jgi:RNA polymerase sigma-70 factor (ECF subfamily)
VGPVSNLHEAGTEVAMASGEVALRTSDYAVAGVAAEKLLVELCRQGDATAFGRLVALHEGMVYNLAARLLGDREEAKDVSQDVFLQVYRHLGRFQGRSSLKTWIYRIVVNQCRNRRRFWHRRRADRALSLEALPAAEEARVAAPMDSGRESPFETACRTERARRVREALLGLPFHHRAVLVLREIEGVSCAAIAEALDVPEGTVKSRLARAREALRQTLAPLLREGDPR